MKNGKLRVLLLIEASGSGAGRHVLDLADGLAQSGHEVHLLYSPLRIEDAFLQRIRELDGAIYSKDIAMRRSISPWHDMRSYTRVVEYTRKFGPFDIVHGHSSKAGALARLIKIFGARSAKIVYTPHAFITLSPGLSGLKRMAYSAIERFLGRRFSDAVIAVSHQEAEHAVELGLPASRVHTIANGVGPAKDVLKHRGEQRQALNIASDDVVIGFSGRLDYQKAPEVLLEAYLALGTGVDTHLVFLGEGPERQKLEGIAGAHHITGAIHIVGYHAMAQEFLSAFDIFVLPSRYEGLPYTLLEAMATGLPVVATAVGGNCELVREGVNGFLVPPDSAEDLKKALYSLVHDAELRERFGRALLEIIRSTYSKRTMVEQTLELYRSL